MQIIQPPENRDLTIPGWALVLMGTLGALVLSWLIYLTIQAFDNKKDIAINNANDNRVGEQIRDLKQDMKERIEKLEVHVNGKFDALYKAIQEISKS